MEPRRRPRLVRVRHCWTDTAVQRAQFQPAKLSHNDVLLRFVDSRADRFAARSTHPTGGRRGTRDARRGHTHTRDADGQTRTDSRSHIVSRPEPRSGTPDPHHVALCDQKRRACPTPSLISRLHCTRGARGKLDIAQLRRIYQLVRDPHINRATKVRALIYHM